jgi:hypothetical protein
MKKKYFTIIKAQHRKHMLPCFVALLLVLFLHQGVNAQSFKESQYNKRIFSVNSGAVFSGDGDCWGIGTVISHLKTIGKRFYIRQNLTSWIINGESWIAGAFENQTAIDLSTELGFSPFKMGERFISIHGGVCGAFMINSDPTGGGSWQVYNFNTGEYSYMQYYEQILTRDLDLGFCFGINYHRQFSPVLYLNARADFRSHFSTGSAISMITLGIGFDARELFNK